MADMVKIPGIGPVKKPWLYAGVALTVGIIGFAYWQRSRNTAAAGAAPAEAAAATTDYSEASTAAGYNEVYPSAYSGYSPYGYDLYGNPLPPPTGAGSSGPYTTNNDWATAAESALEQAGVDLSTSGAAISRVLGGLTVTSAQRDLFMQAVGLLGQPPQGYPTPIKLVDTPAQPGPTPTTGKPGKVGGLHAAYVSTSQIRIAWDAVSGATNYAVYMPGSSGWQWVGNAGGTSFTRSGLRKGTRYKFKVAAFNSAGYGPQSNELDVATHH